MKRRSVERLLPKLAKLAKAPEPPLLRELFRTDLFALLYMGCRRHDLGQQWFIDRCDEINADPDGHLDLWAREHGKSSIITFGQTLQDILRDPEVTIGIFSHTRPIAKGFFRQIKRELESNKLLLELYPDILWENPKRDAPKWSEDDGIVVQRKGNPKESTVEAWGLVDGQPIGKHYRKLVYDDIVTRENAASPDMRNKTLAALELSYNLGTRGGVRRFIGTRYHYADAYAAIMDRKTAIPRIYPAMDADGVPALMSREELDEKRRDFGPFTFSSQMMLDPKEEGSVGFKREWWRTYAGTVRGNTYILIDPANAKKKKSDYTAAWVITLGEDGNRYVRWMVRDRLNLTERVALVMNLHRDWEPRGVGYEEYGMQADIQAIEAEQSRQGYRFTVTPLGGTLSKYDRIMGLVATFERGEFWFPPYLQVPCKDEESATADMVRTFREQEYDAWPYSAHDDMLDSLARLDDPAFSVVWPRTRERKRRTYRYPAERAFVV